jgi:hypothetical protein
LIFSNKTFAENSVPLILHFNEVRGRIRRGALGAAGSGVR